MEDWGIGGSEDQGIRGWEDDDDGDKDDDDDDDDEDDIQESSAIFSDLW